MPRRALNSQQPALVIERLSKTYRTGLRGQARHVALRDLSLTVPSGEVFGFLGPNGSGKTTTLKILMGLVRADAGRARILGIDHRDLGWRYRVGYLPEHPYLYDYLTPREYLDYVGRLFSVPARLRTERSRDLLERVGLTRAADAPMRRFSKGMVQRVGLAQALVNDPELVILDEPMSGLDPVGRRLVRDLILELKGRGKTVFFSTHILPDAEALCDGVALLRFGDLVNVGPLDGILDIDVSHMEVLATGLPPEAVETLPGLRARQALGERWTLQVAEAELVPFLSAVTAAGGRVVTVQPVRQSLEEFFFRELGEAAKGEAWQLGD